MSEATNNPAGDQTQVTPVQPPQPNQAPAPQHEVPPAPHADPFQVSPPQPAPIQEQNPQPPTQVAQPPVPPQPQQQAFAPAPLPPHYYPTPYHNPQLGYYPHPGQFTYPPQMPAGDPPFVQFVQPLPNQAPQQVQQPQPAPVPQDPSQQPPAPMPAPTQVQDQPQQAPTAVQPTQPAPSGPQTPAEPQVTTTKRQRIAAGFLTLIKGTFKALFVLSLSVPIFFIAKSIIHNNYQLHLRVNDFTKDDFNLFAVNFWAFVTAGASVLLMIGLFAIVRWGKKTLSDKDIEVPRYVRMYLTFVPLTVGLAAAVGIAFVSSWIITLFL